MACRTPRRLLRHPLGEEMLETLLESKSRSEGSPGGAILSVTAHTALLAAALYATAQARVRPAQFPETVRPVYFAPDPLPVQSASPATSGQRYVNGHRLIFVAPDLDIKTPSIDISDVASKPGDFSHGAIESGSNNVQEGGGGSGGAPFRADQVEKQVEVVPGNTPPRYPEVLRSSGVEGQVIAEFVVDGQGHAEEGSLRFVRSDNQLFEEAVRAALRRMRFIPAEVAGMKVRQLVQMPFVFTLSR
jgi:protein TonB